MLVSLPPIPAHEDSYRWAYADFASANVSAVFIFMIGSVFSRRYAAGRGHPVSHCAVNFALYRGGKRLAWVLSEYKGILATKTRWKIGRSSVELCEDGKVRFDVDERTARGQRTRAELVLQPTAPPLKMFELLPASTHTWQALAPRAQAMLRVDGDTHGGRGYLDSNAGATKLGTNLREWRWSRVHGPEHSEIRYAVDGGLQTLVRVRDRSVETLPLDALQPSRKSWWGLPVPHTVPFGCGHVDAGHVVESSPFYARQHGMHGDTHVSCESANFARFRSPLVRWMADWRTRYEEATA